MKRKKYSAGAVKFALWFMEFRKAIQLLEQGKTFDEIKEQWILLIRLVPLVENNFNLCELGPRSTGKSHIYKKVSPNSILVSGGQTTVANLFLQRWQAHYGTCWFVGLCSVR